jgi:hypothetical protein
MTILAITHRPAWVDVADRLSEAGRAGSAWSTLARHARRRRWHYVRLVTGPRSNALRKALAITIETKA